MDVRTFRAPSMQVALQMVRQELGSGAVILHTREVRSARWRRLFRRVEPRQVEVTAGTGMNVRTSAPPRTRPRLSESHARAPRTASIQASEAGAKRSERESQIAQQLETLKSMVAELQQSARREPSSDVPESLFHVYSRLIEHDVDQELARDLVGQLQIGQSSLEFSENAPEIDQQLSRMVQRDLSISGPIRIEPGRQKVVALIGATGVGKTTTIAKLAAHFRLREHARIGLITVDTYRIAAVEQLRTYAEIIDLPMKVVMTPREMSRALAEMEGLDLVLLDTAGRSPSDDLKIRELKSFLSAAGVHEVHLVLSSVSSPSSLVMIAERFASAAPTSVVLTKLDEAAALGGLLKAIKRIGLPLSYLTTGQNVPDDIEPADDRRLARLILGQEALGRSPRDRASAKGVD